MFLETMTKGLSRRRAMGGMLGAGAVAGLAGSGLAATSASAANPNIVPLKLDDPRDNLYAFAKMWGTIGKEPVISAYQGVQYGVVGRERARPLFGLVGFGNIRNEMQPDGSARIMGRECAFFRDLETGKIMDHWDNPWTGERVKVYDFINHDFRGTLGLTRKVYEVNGSTTVSDDGMGLKGRPPEEEPYLLPWQKIGDQYLVSYDYSHEYVNPVTPEGWPKANSGVRVNPSEHFVLFTPVNEIEDRTVVSARYTGGFMRQSPWWPWMMMGQSKARDGILTGRMHTYKITGTTDDIPAGVLERVKLDHPDLLDPPVDGPDLGVVDTFGRYARDVPPEVAGYVRPKPAK